MESYGFSSKVRLCLLKMKVDGCRKNAVLMFKQPGKEKIETRLRFLEI